ncbi:galactokinase [Helcococcus kunzii ATCC 51366]|uniref:Galactokinase n=1 Tax=Helcococcus kunzii ATCC 51366 TaxID=883114 RepID=H3NPH3_9FIRM|nr:galactokinase [Helcococcus kunzii]EHR33486.1 galactokinase [Helcococcus kunzii ATCC 51366]
MEIKELQSKFIEKFGENDKEIKRFFSPSRINIIGEHIDYNGGKVFPCALEIGTYAIARKNDDNVLNLYSLNMENNGKIDIDDLVYKKENDWMNYAAGMAKYIKESGFNIGGLDVLVYGNIPNGSGLSSSASLEMLIGEIFNIFYNEKKIDRTKLSLLGQDTENKFFGLNTGIMDQFIIANGKKDHALLLDTNTLEFEHYPFDLKDNKIVILNTNKRRELKDSKYNERRAQCDEAVSILKNYKDIKYLCELGEEDLHLLENIPDEIVRNRAKHAILENARVKEAAQALQDGNIEQLGKLLIESNDSLRELYEVSGEHLDSITKHSNEFEYCLGARMTGAGFGGCGIAIVKEDKIEEFKKYVFEKYKEDTGLEAEFISSNVGESVHEIK